jgi:membrane protease YdiL (CAAX protease family)
VTTLQPPRGRHRAPEDPRAADARAMMRVALLAVAALLAAEWVVAHVDPVLGAVAHAVVLVALLLRWVWLGEQPVLILALVPLARVTALAMTPRHSGLTAYVVTGLPLLVAVVWAIRNSEITRARLRTPGSWPAVLVAASGLPLGWAAATYLDLPVLPHASSLRVIIAGTVIVFLFAGVLEELLFRGLLQGVLEGPFGGWAVLLADALFAAMYLPTRDPGAVFWIALIGLFWGWYVRRTGGLRTVAVAHGLLAAGALVIWPGLT